MRIKRHTALFLMGNTVLTEINLKVSEVDLNSR